METELFPKLMISDTDKKLIANANNQKQELSHDTLFSRHENIIFKKSLGNHTAVIDVATNRQHTHNQLIHESNLLSRQLSHLSNHSPLIGVLTEKGYNQVVCTLAIMKSGHGYLPLHVDWPVGRLDEILEQGGVSILLLSKNQYSKQPLRDCLSKKYTLMVIEELLSFCTNTQQMAILQDVDLPKVSADNVAYVIFTSGSTGKPKGVTITHKSALNTIDGVNRQFSVTDQDSVFALSELSFDLSVYDIFGVLAVGGNIIFPEQTKTKDPTHWIQVINQYQITLWNTVPQLADLLIEELKGRDSGIGSIRLFLLSGDWIPTRLPKHLKQYCKDAKIISLGGATEGSIWSIWYDINRVEEEWHKIPYGVAMPNQKMYVLNQDNEHCPIGVTGEIHIGGMGVALNYWRNDALTLIRFIEHPKLGRLYKTGDLGRWHKEGYMEFMGRNDFQVKINGHRVELEEIATKLSKLNGIQEAFVRIQKYDDLDYMIAYLLPQNNTTISNELFITERSQDATNTNTSSAKPFSLNDIINQRLSESLPDYMLPSAYVILEDLPLSANGKLDFSKLPKPEFYKTYTPPETELDIKLSEIWSEILGLPSNKIGIHDNFFAIGGNSLMAVQLVIRIKKNLGVRLELMNLKNITISEIGKRLKSQALDTTVVNTPTSNIVMIKEGDTKKQIPLILIHPTGGDLYFYYGLASSLPDDQTVYAIRSPMLEGRKDFESIEEMASSYLLALEDAGINTPYVLGGSSFGGIVAYHMAQILHTNSIATPLIVLIDTPAYGNMPKALTEQEILEYLIKYGLSHLPISIEILRLKNSLEEQIQYMADAAKETALQDMISTEFLPVFINTWQVNTAALLKYVPSIYTGPIVYFSHTEIIEEFPTNQPLYWSKYAKGKFKQFSAPGNHISMNASPNIEVITQQLYKEIQAIGGRS